jgi:hypothetical protein
VFAAVMRKATLRGKEDVAQANRHSAYERHIRAAAYHSAAAHHAHQAAIHHQLGEISDAQKHAAAAHKESAAAQRDSWFAYGQAYK